MKNINFRRLSAILLAVATVFSGIPVNAATMQKQEMPEDGNGIKTVGILSETDEESIDFVGDPAEPEDVGKSGSCGESAQWSLSDDGTLSITGSGKIQDYDIYGPWGYYRDSITKVTISEEITSIGDCAFYECSGLVSVEIPESVTSIGAAAFGDCNSLISIVIPEGVKYIGDYAFSGCKNLTTIEVDRKNAVYSSEDGVLFDKKKEELLCFPGGKKGKYTIPSGVKNIVDSAFSDCEDLTSVIIPEGVISIGINTFYNCRALTEIVLPSSITSIGNQAFWQCESLKNIEIPEGITYISDGAFWQCESLTGVEIPEGVTHIGGNAFSGCSSLTEILIPSSVISIGGNAFLGCSSLTKVEIPEKVTSIKGYVFLGCNSLTEITLPVSITSIEYGAFFGCGNLTICCIENSYAHTYAKENNFSYKFTQPTTPGTSGSTLAVGTCGENVQWNLSNDGILNFTGSGEMQDYEFVSDVPWYPYSNKITKVTISSGISGIGESVFYGCSNLIEIVIPTSVTSIQDWAFGQCENLTSIVIPDSVISIGDNVFNGCDNLTIYCTENSYAYKYVVENDMSYELGQLTTPETDKPTVPGTDKPTVSGTDKPAVPGMNPPSTPTTNTNTNTKTSLAKAVITLSANTYNYDGKEKKPAVKSVVLNGKTLKSGTDYTVSSYANNKNIGTAAVTITGKGNYNGTAKKTFKITAKKGSTFAVGSNKYKITSSSSVAFTGLKSSSTKKVTIPKMVKIGGKNFNVTSIAANALKNKKVTKITVGSNVKTIGKNAFYKCTKLTKVTLGSSVTSIGDNVFSGCAKLTGITLPSKVTVIGKGAFTNCKKLGTITIKSTKLKTVGKNAFRGIKASAKIKVPAKKLSAYRKLLKGKGQGSKVKINKM